MDFQTLLRFAVEHDASDVHIQTGAAPRMRIAGQVRTVEMDAVSNDDLKGFISSIAPEAKQADLSAAIKSGLDFSYAVPGLARFRCSAYSHLGQVGVTIRIIRAQIPSIKDLHLPETVHDIARSRRGLTLVTGTTGSGKSTTLAAMIDLIN